MRYKEYNVNKVLEQSIALFWKKGVNGCSVNDLVEATNVNRFSLYHEFDNKQGILYATIDLYRQRYCDKRFALLKKDGDIVEVLIDFYKSFLDEKQEVPGCYMIHIGTELADTDQRVKVALEAYLTEIQNLMNSLLLINGFKARESQLISRHLLGLFCTAMSFCLIFPPEEQKKYLLNSIHLILSKHATSIT